ncbi:hypothetical protein MRB53_041403 [Persea americana]|nr:hypothetical protein MRB53_041403 [Persea americana]
MTGPRLEKRSPRLSLKSSRRLRSVAWANSCLSMDDSDKESVIGDFLFNSIYIGIPINNDPRELSRQINRTIDGNR